MSRLLGVLTITMLSTACSAAGADEASEHRPSRTPPTESLSLMGKVLDYGAGADLGAGLEGVQVCASQPNLGCSTTSAEGYTFDGLSPSAQFRLSFSKSGYMPSIVDVELGENSFTEDGVLLAAPFVERLAQSREAELPAGTGGVLLTAYMLDYDGLLPLSGVSFEIEDQTGAFSVYVDDNREPLKDGTKTQARGWGVALGVRPGLVEGVVSHELSGARCGPLDQDEVELNNRFEAEVVAGTLTRVSVICFYKG